MNKAFALDLAAHNIRSNTIAPTFIETPLTRPYLADPVFKSQVLAKIKLGRIGQVEDITLVPERGGEILLRLLGRYGIGLESGLAKSLLAKVEQEVAICITPSHISSWDFSSRMVGATSAG